MDQAAVFGLFLICGAALAAPAVKTWRNPRRWQEGRGRWMLFVKRGESAPGTAEVRFWAAVWLLIAVAIVTLGAAVAFA